MNLDLDSAPPITQCSLLQKSVAKQMATNSHIETSRDISGNANYSLFGLSNRNQVVEINNVFGNSIKKAKNEWWKLTTVR
jgi:hypothetical protein